MENASKALLMAAGVLIGILILSLAVYLFTTFGATSAEVHRENEASRINQFNAQFTSYEGRSDITIHDIITVINLAKDNNQKYELTTQTDYNYYISVYAMTTKGIGISEASTNAKIDEAVSYEINNLIDRTDDNGVTVYKGLQTYSCKVTLNPNTERVKNVMFTKN